MGALGVQPQQGPATRSQSRTRNLALHTASPLTKTPGTTFKSRTAQAEKVLLKLVNKYRKGRISQEELARLATVLEAVEARRTGAKPRYTKTDLPAGAADRYNAGGRKPAGRLRTLAGLAGALAAGGAMNSARPSAVSGLASVLQRYFEK